MVPNRAKHHKKSILGRRYKNNRCYRNPHETTPVTWDDTCYRVRYYRGRYYIGYTFHYHDQNKFKWKSWKLSFRWFRSSVFSFDDIKDNFIRDTWNHSSPIIIFADVSTFDVKIQIFWAKIVVCFEGTSYEFCSAPQRALLVRVHYWY